MPELVYLSLGSNVGDREKNLREAIDRLGALGRVVSLSSFTKQSQWSLRASRGS